MICCARNGLRQSRGGSSVIEMRRAQLSFGDGLIAEEVSDLREDWMKHADEVLADVEIVSIVYGELAKRNPNSRCRGRRGTPAEVVLRLLTQNGTPSTHPLQGDELRALRRLQRESKSSPFVFVSERSTPFTTAGFARMIERRPAGVSVLN